MRQEVDVQWWNDPDVDHLTDSFWVKEAMQHGIGLFWFNHVRKDRLPMPKNLTVTLDTERGVVVVSDERVDECPYDCDSCRD